MRDRETLDDPPDPGIDWDLLEPTLTAADDVAGLSRPFNPWTVVVLMVFCQPVLGGFQPFVAPYFHQDEVV